MLKLPNHHQRILVLDFSRLVAALCVVLFHISSGTNSLLNMGYLSVDYFFVLSGFVLAPTMLGIQTLNSALFFVKRRFIRLFPNTALSLAIVTIVTTAIWQFGSRESIVWRNFSITSIVGYLTLMSIFASQAISLNYPIWSLSTEFVSNIVFAIQRLGANKPRIQLIFLCAFPICFSVSSMGSFILGSERAWIDPLIRTCSGLAIGCLLHQFFSEMTYPIVKLSVLILGFCLIVTGELELGFQILSCLIIKLLTEYSIQIENLLHDNLLLISGELSFLIYLFHVPILSCVDLSMVKLKLMVSSELYIQAPIRVIIVLVFTGAIVKIRKYLQFMVLNK